MRCGYVELASRAGRRSEARLRNCIFCGEHSRNTNVHVLGKCRVWQQARNVFLNTAAAEAGATPADVAVAILSTKPHAQAFPTAVSFCEQVDHTAEQYWRDVWQKSDRGPSVM